MTSCEETFVIPLHPRTRKNLASWDMLNGLECAENVVLTEPKNFMAFTSLEKNARKIMTDSGGVQKEAYFFGVPCITLRDETEWVETLEDGWNVLVGARRTAILEALTRQKPIAKRRTSYGDRRVSRRIVDIVERCFQ
jgi:UDP-N-acetylglucosamine 2-epimerase